MALIANRKIFDRDIPLSTQMLGQNPGYGLFPAPRTTEKLELAIPDRQILTAYLIFYEMRGTVLSARQTPCTVRRRLAKGRGDLFAVPAPNGRYGLESHPITNSSTKTAKDAVVPILDRLVTGLHYTILARELNYLRALRMTGKEQIQYRLAKFVHFGSMRIDNQAGRYGVEARRNIVTPAIPRIARNLNNAQPAGSERFDRLMVTQCRDVYLLPTQHRQQHLAFFGLNNLSVYSKADHIFS